MIVDFHRHLWSLSERYPRSAELVGRSGDPTAAETTPLVPDWQETGEKLIAEMDDAGVDRSVTFVPDYALRLGDGIFSPHGENLIQVELMRKYPDRIIPFFGIDPRRLGAGESFERAVKEWGVKGLKLHPAVGYFPHDRAAYPLYQTCVDHGLPVIFHSGPMPSPFSAATPSRCSSTMWPPTSPT